ncbi:MAG: anti-sigma factor family protein [Myxococcota bacterium]
MSPCDRIEHHLSALADGELRPLEAIAVRRHVEDCPRCHRAFHALEALKVQLHVAGGECVPTEAQKERWLRAIEERAATARARRQRLRRWIPVAAAAALACIVALAWSFVDAGPAQPTSAHAAAGGRLDGEAMERMVRVHRGEIGPSSLDDLVQAGALVTFESLPGSFITPEGERNRVVQASFADCDESMLGASLAVLRASEVDLPPEVDASLLAGGVYVEVLDGAEVRISRSGDKVFVLLSEIYPAGGSI